MHPSEQAQVATPAATVFPLALTPFEYYYYSDDCAEYPTTFPVELRFSGTLVREHFAAALEETVRRHPLLRALVDEGGKNPAWVDDQHGGLRIDWQDASAAINPEGGERIDLRTAPGLRTWVRASGHAARVLFQFHHACCDGLAALQFVRDFLGAYKVAAGTLDAPPREIDPELLRSRGKIAAGGPHLGEPSLSSRNRSGGAREKRRRWIRR
jgi:NRPS condensation-like uncharacterized protein